MYYLFYKLAQKNKNCDNIYLWLITTNNDLQKLKNWGNIKGKKGSILVKDIDEWMIIEGDINEKIIEKRRLSLQEFNKEYGEWIPEQ